MSNWVVEDDDRCSFVQTSGNPSQNALRYAFPSETDGNKFNGSFGSCVERMIINKT